MICFQSDDKKYELEWELDEHDTPTEKLPNCPRCDEDELGVIHAGHAFCYACYLKLWSIP